MGVILLQRGYVAVPLSTDDVKATVGDKARTPTPAEERGTSPRPAPELDYQAAVNALTLQFLNEHEATRVAAIAWLIMLHRMAPGKVRRPLSGQFVLY